MRISDILTGPEKWTKGVSARDANGDVCAVESKEAVQFCLSGACLRLGLRREDTLEVLRIIDDAAIRRGFQSFVTFNDAPSTTFADVRELLSECGQ